MKTFRTNYVVAATFRNSLFNCCLLYGQHTSNGYSASFECDYHIRRIKTEEKAKVVAAAWEQH